MLELSRFSKQFKMLGGGALLALAYIPALLDSSGGKGVFIDSGSTFFTRSNSVLDGKPIFQAKLTEALIPGCVWGLGRKSSAESKFFASVFDPKNFVTNGFGIDGERELGSDSPKISRVAKSENTESVASEPLRFKDIKSGPYKGGRLVKGTIRSNFYVDAKRLAIPVKVIDKVIRSLSSKIDFRRSLRKGDQFEIAFNAKNELIYSRIKTKRRQAFVYKFGKEGYFFENGERVGGRRSVGSFAAPIRGKLRVSSPFGLRLHPVTGKYKRHSGVDLIASHGTPVYAIYDGVVTRASRYAGYGKCVDIKHKNGYSSRYAHLSRMVVRPGARIRKGQLIAYSGATGVATGPHLHLELARNNVNLNPLGVRMMTEKPQRVSNNKQFNSLRNYFRSLSNSVK